MVHWPLSLTKAWNPLPESKSTIAEVSDALKGTVNRVSGAIEAGRKPGMPLRTTGLGKADEACDQAAVQSGYC